MDAPTQTHPPLQKKRWLTRFDLIVLILLGSAIILAVAKDYQAAESRRRAEPDVRAVLDAQAAAWNRGDLDGFMAGYWHSDELTFCSGGDVTKGWQGTYDRYRKRYQADGREMGRLEFSDVSVEVVTHDLALVRGRWKLTLANDAPHGL